MNEKGYKGTILGIIPEDWRISSLGELGDFIKGQGIAKSDLKENGLPAIRYGEIYTHHHFYIKNFNSFISPEASGKSRKLNKGDLLFTCSGENREEIGKAVAYLNDEEAYAGGDLAILRNAKQDSLFLGFLLNDEIVNKQKFRLAEGHSVVHIYPQELSEILIPLPTIEEQKAIATCLSTWDRAIHTLTRLIEQKKQRKKWLMQVLLTGKKRLPGFNRNWKIVSLGEITNRIIRRNEELNDNVVTISSQKGFVKQEEFFTKRVASNTLSDYYLIKKGEFAYNKSYSNGYPMGSFNRLDNFDHAVVTTLYICFAVKSNVNSDFIKQFLSAGLMNRGLTRIAQEGGRAHGLLNIGLSDFYELKLKVPEFVEQTAIAIVLKTADREIEMLTKKLSFFKEQKKGLMQQLLTGRKRLKIPE